MASSTPQGNWPVFSFRYGGQASASLLPAWTTSTRVHLSPGGATTDQTWTDPATGLRVTARFRRFDAFAATEWVLELENTGRQDTPLVEDLQALDWTTPLKATDRCRLHWARGSACRLDDFLPMTDDIGPNGQIVLKPQGGRSSNGTLPFMNLQQSEGGLILAVGWSGQWAVAFQRSREALRVTAGMETTRLRLRPGERIRTPRILVIDWTGPDPEVGQNLLRRLLIAHYLPRLGGELVLPPVAQCLQAHYYLTGEAGEKLEMEALPKAAALGCEAYWIDACWYGFGLEWWREVGNWVVNRQRYPNGLKPIAEAAHRAGMKFVLWFEPERVQTGTTLDREHPEWLLRSPANPSNALLNLGLPEARAHMLDLVSTLIEECGVDIYRQDFNFDPLPYWQAADAPDRVGLTEIRYNEGLYAFWDELRRRHPHVWIDNCASGGRRLDLETVSRALPLWPSDFPDIVGLPFGLGLHVGDQVIKAGLARWVPLAGGGVWNFTPYATRSQISGGFTFGFHIPHEHFAPDDAPSAMSFKDVLCRGYTLASPQFPMEAARQAIAEWKDLRPFFLGDFHLLLPLTVAYHDWCACQFHRPDLEAGFALFLRRHRSPFPTMTASLRDIDPAGQYEVSESFDYAPAPAVRRRGTDLRHLAVTIPDQPGSLLLRYRRTAPPR